MGQTKYQTIVIKLYKISRCMFLPFTCICILYPCRTARCTIRRGVLGLRTGLRSVPRIDHGEKKRDAVGASRRGCRRACESRTETAGSREKERIRHGARTPAVRSRVGPRLSARFHRSTAASSAASYLPHRRRRSSHELVKIMPINGR